MESFRHQVERATDMHQEVKANAYKGCRTHGDPTRHARYQDGGRVSLVVDWESKQGNAVAKRRKERADVRAT